MSLVEFEIVRQSNPVDMIEFVAANNDWSFERSGEDEIAMTVEGKWSDYHVSFSWMEEFEALHLACAFDVKVPESRVNEVIRLLSHVNGQVLMGHFDLWRHEDVVIFRQSLLLAGGAEPSIEQRLTDRRPTPVGEEACHRGDVGVSRHAYTVSRRRFGARRSNQRQDSSPCRRSTRPNTCRLSRRCCISARRCH